MSNLEDLERRVRESRINEATKKHLIGVNGKIAIVVRGLGSPVIAQYDGSQFYDIMNSEEYLGDPFEEIVQEDHIPTTNFNDEFYPELEGWEWSERPRVQEATTDLHSFHFNGISRGMHLEISLYPDTAEIKALYRGQQVYQEIRGELMSYVPNDEWEECINKLYPTALAATKQRSQESSLDKMEEQEKIKDNWLTTFKKLWGI